MEGLAALPAAVAASVGTPVVCVAVSAPGCCAGAAGLLLRLAGRGAPRLCLLPGRLAVWGAVAATLIAYTAASVTADSTASAATALRSSVQHKHRP